MSAPISIRIDLEDREAWVLAQFLKRVTFDTARRHADPARPNEPYEMLEALEKVRTALREKGVAPR